MSRCSLASVIIPCYNCEEYLENTIKSVWKQTYPNVELILVDDGSTDRTAEIIGRYEDRAICHFGPNRGASAARTTGTKLASGDFIQYLDADDRLRRQALQLRITALKETPADVAYSAYQRWVEDREGFSPGNTVDKTLEEAHPDPEIATLGAFWVPPAALTYRRRIVEQIGEWNDNLPVIQDARFLQDAAFHGAQFVKVPEVLAEYRDHKDGSLSSQDKHAFNCDVWVNARQIEERWRERQEGLTDTQKERLAGAYDYCARALFGVDRAIYTQALSRVRDMKPEKVSKRLKRYARAERYIGYKAAAAIEELRKRGIEKTKSVLRPLYEVLKDLKEGS
ncbi:glycosyltransferase involved in cell wall biosynthesis [Salinibacter ruber]|uniref:glycosyltransferase n=1 Tax=Salinibacter ruber TaxID=146919 RepID=UPI00161558CD|nr:glycosyltransferase [Salinibacter ruber]MBB4070342.1 glycosyltransferase involved in cell wall biosynthesis [Salinibacter ruber]